MAGKDYILYLSDDATSAGNDTEIEDQGDLTINPGKPLTGTAFKTSSRASQGRDLWSARTSFSPRAPLGTGQALVYAAMDNGGTQHATVKSATTGAITWEGPVKLTVTEQTHPVSGESIASLELMEDGVIARGTTA